MDASPARRCSTWRKIFGDVIKMSHGKQRLDAASSARLDRPQSRRAKIRVHIRRFRKLQKRQRNMSNTFAHLTDWLDSEWHWQTGVHRYYTPQSTCILVDVVAPSALLANFWISERIILLPLFRISVLSFSAFWLVRWFLLDWSNRLKVKPSR